MCVDFLLVLYLSGSDERVAKDEEGEYLSGKMEVEEEEGEEERIAGSIVDECE